MYLPGKYPPPGRGICAVPVLPATRKPSIKALRPEPCTTARSSSALNRLAVSRVTGWATSSGAKVSTTSPVRAFTWLTRRGRINLPSLAIADIAATCCSAVTAGPCPKLVVASSTGPSCLNMMPTASPGRSTPVLLPKPKSEIYLENTCAPSFCPTLTKPGLQDRFITPLKSSLPCPLALQQERRTPDT